LHRFYRHDEYKLSKALLCKQSLYFAAIFERNFEESEDQSTILVEADDVVIPQSFQILVQWLYHHKLEVSTSIGLDDTTLEQMRSVAKKVVLQCVPIQININVLLSVIFFGWLIN
jgi:hypothetical protein